MDKLKKREYHRQYYRDNREKLKIRARKRYEKSKERCRIYGIQYRKDNKEYIKQTKKRLVYCDICDTYGQHTSIRQHERTDKHQQNRHLRNKN